MTEEGKWDKFLKSPMWFRLAVVGQLVFIIFILSSFKHEWLPRFAALEKEVQALRQATATVPGERELFLKILIRKPSCDQSVARAIASTVARLSQDFHRDPDLVLAVIEVESNYQLDSVSPAGAVGLMQVMPQWVEVFGIHCSLKEPGCNVKAGLQLLASYEQLYGNLKVALTVYNRGPSPVDWAFIKGQDPDNGYAGKILRAYEEIQAL